MRATFIRKLLDWAERDPTLTVVTGDLGYTVFEPFMEKYPQRFLNVGVGEEDMIGISAGLALAGRKVFAYSITPFSTARPLEQIRLDVCYHQLPVRIIGAGAGLSYGTLGSSHHGTEDLATLRALPNMTVCAPADKHELAALLDWSMEYDGPVYIRIGRSVEPDVHSAPPTLTLGRGVPAFHAGDAFSILACGNMVWTAVQAAKQLQAAGLQGQVFSIPFVKPLDEELVRTLAARPLFTLEEHSRIGGLGSAVAEVLVDSALRPPAFMRIALPDAFQKKVGSHDYLRRLNGLMPEQVAETIQKKLG
jgi:transketolase